MGMITFRRGKLGPSKMPFNLIRSQVKNNLWLSKYARTGRTKLPGMNSTTIPPLKIIHVGCGGISRAWFEAMKAREAAEYVALVDFKPEAARKRAAEFELGDVPIHTSLEEALERHAADVVFDCTVPAAHREVTLAALKAGCHVLGEKPMAESMEHAREMVEAAREAGRIYAVIQNRRYAANIRRVREALASGLIGRAHTVNADFYIGPHFGGFREEMAHVLLLDMAIHSFDQARFLSDSAPRSVYCHEYNPPGSWFRHGASAMAVFRMTGDLVFNYRGSWCAEGLNTSWQCDWRIIGEKGSLTWDGEDGIRIQTVDTTQEGFLRDGRDVDPPEIDWDPADNGHGGLIRDFLKAVRGGPPPLTRCGDNIKSLAMVFAAIESAKCGQPVEIDLTG